MIRYTSFKQLSIEEFKTPFEKEIDTNNRWVILANSLPWDELAGIYHKAMSTKGAPAKDPRIVIGALIVKHKLGISGDETIQIIRENPYIQYFLGIKEFTNNPVFDSGLFSSVLKRLGVDTFNTMQQEIIEKALNIRLKSKKDGLIIADKASSDHPTDFSANLRLLSDARIASEEMIDTLCSVMKYTPKPTTFRYRAVKEYVKVLELKTHTKKENFKAIGRQISFLKRDIRNIHKLLNIYTGSSEQDKLQTIKTIHPIPLNGIQLKRFWVIQHVLTQQMMMHKSGKNHCPDRIIDIDQPQVRPIAKTKAKFHLLKTRIQLLQQVF